MLFEMLPVMTLNITASISITKLQFGLLLEASPNGEGKAKVDLIVSTFIYSCGILVLIQLSVLREPVLLSHDLILEDNCFQCIASSLKEFKNVSHIYHESLAVIGYATTCILKTNTLHQQPSSG